MNNAPNGSKPGLFHAITSRVPAMTAGGRRGRGVKPSAEDETKTEASTHVDATTLPSEDVESSRQGCDSLPLTDEDRLYPEGGLEAWLVTFGAWSAMVAGLGLVNTIGTLQAYVQTHQLRDYSTSSVSWIFSIYVFLVFFCGLQIGPIFDARGPRALIFVGSVLIVACMMLLGVCTAYWHFILVFSIVGGLGSSLLFTPAVASISHFFLARRSTATGLAATGGSFGGIIFPLALRALLPQVGFAWATRILGFVFLVLVSIANMLVRGRLPSKRLSGSSSSSSSSDGGDAASAANRLSSILPDLRIFLDGTGALALVTAGTFFMEFGLFVPVTYLTSYCLDSTRGAVDASLAYQIIAIMNAGSCFGRWVPGLAADKLGRFNVMIIMLVLCLATVFALWLPAEFATRDAVVPLVVVFAVLFGFGSGSNISLTPTCVGQLCDTAHYGRYYATCYTVVSFSTLTGIPIAGAIVEATPGGRYWGLILFTGLSYVAATACFVWVRVLNSGWKVNAIW